MDFLSLLYGAMRKSVAESEIETAKLRVTAAVMDLAGQTRMAFYRVQADEQMLEMFRQIVLATEAGYEFAHQLHEAGNIPELDHAAPTCTLRTVKARTRCCGRFRLSKIANNSTG